MYFRTELTETMLFNLAQQISSSQELRRLSVLGLKVPTLVTDTNLTKYRDINLAAYEILKYWFSQKKNNVQAYDELCEILRKSGKTSYINFLQDDQQK